MIMLMGVWTVLLLMLMSTSLLRFMSVCSCIHQLNANQQQLIDVERIFLQQFKLACLIWHI